MNILQEKRRALGVHRLYKGGSSNDSTSSQSTTNTNLSTSVNTTQTTNNDRRLVLQDATAVGDGSSFFSSSDNDTQTTIYSTVQAADAAVLGTFANSLPDAVRALGGAGADVLSRVGGAVVDLNRDSINANQKSWDSTLDYGSAFVDRSIDMIAESFGIASANLKNAQDVATKNIDGAYGLAAKAVDSFTPTENKNAEIGKYAMLAAAAVCALVFLKDAK